LNFRKNGRFRRVDVGIDPYGVKWEINTGSPENAAIFAGRARFSISFVGADNSVRPQNLLIFRGYLQGPMPISARSAAHCAAAPDLCAAKCCGGLTGCTKKTLLSVKIRA